MSAKTEYRALSHTECVAILARHRVGRLAYAFKDKVDIEPIGYVWDTDTLFFRTAQGFKLETLQHSPWVAFEVDEIESPVQWASVVVKGTVYFLRSSGTEFDVATWERGRAALRRADPSFETPRDTASHRTYLFRIHVDEITGRAAGSPRA
jgi:nitroimidazol reductase NimA-like FMN-containing flavoprotein (pyridoxamine 5'-phosphate oxidase superfamily)